MTYTKTKPSAPGWYWWRIDGNFRPGFYQHTSEGIPPDGEFAGPIPEPVEQLSEAEANKLIEELKRAVTDKDFASEFIKARAGDVVDGVVGKYAAALFVEAEKRAKQ